MNVTIIRFPGTNCDLDTANAVKKILGTEPKIVSCKENEIPKSGLNFLIGKNFEQNFLLLCGFEKFREFFVRIDILEKLFLKILDNTKEKKFKVNSEMMNLLGCSKENFYKLMTYMNYKKDKTQETYIFKGEKRKKEKILQFDKKENPFNKLLSLNIK